MTHVRNPVRPIAIANWLMVVAVMVVLMVAVGGITRLTESGLSITQWKPITGAIPPLSESAWQAEFDLYKATGEYKNVTGPAGMDLEAFKFIFFWEWFHRLLGRLIGLAFAVPLAWFWIRGAIPRGYKARLVALLALGGLQGVFGWFMVRSGLAGTMTDVSHFWLSIHLLTALFTLGGLIWTALDLRQLAAGNTAAARWTSTANWVGVILFVQLLLGAWVAGLNAGLASDSWPLMQGRFVPEYDESQGTAFVDCSLANSDTTLEFTFSGVTISVAMNELVIVAGYSSRGIPACILGISPTSSTPVLGDTFLRSAYVVYNIAGNEIAMAQTNFNSTSANILEITETTSVPSATAVANAVTDVAVSSEGARIDSPSGFASSFPSSSSSEAFAMPTAAPGYDFALLGAAGAGLLFAL